MQALTMAFLAIPFARNAYVLRRSKRPFDIVQARALLMA